MAQTFAPTQLNITPPPEGFQTGGWYSGRQYWNGTLSEPGVIHPSSDQQGAGALVSPEINLQSDVVQGNQPGDIERYLEEQRRLSAGVAGQQVAPAQPQPTGQPTGAGAETGTVEPLSVQSAFNLPDLYKTLFAESGVTEQEDLLVEREGQFLEAKGKISDNPFLSASQIDQRLQRLQRAYETETEPIRSKIAMQKADIETQLNLQARQFDIESQQARDARQFFSDMLSAGALTNASGEDIANFTRMTGIPSSFIQSAITQSQVKDRDLYIDTFTADSGVVTAVSIDKNTGQVVSQTSLGNIGNQQLGGGGGTATERKEADILRIRSELENMARGGATWDDLFRAGQGFIDDKELYQIYLSYGIYNPDRSQQTTDLKRFRIE